MSGLAEKIVGCLLGGAVGDALGGAHEGRAAGAVEGREAAWRLSDDTQLTLATCEAVIGSGGRVEPRAVAERFAAWHRAGRVTGLGASTYKALSELAAGGHWALVGNKGERAAGNGAAMRVAPLAFCLDAEDADARRTVRDVCRITHHNEEAYAGALAVLRAVRAAASIAGQVLGALGGLGGVPGRMLRRLPNLAECERITRQFAATVATARGVRE